MRRTLLLLVLLVLSAGCANRQFHLRAFPSCADKLPLKVLIDPTCPPDGICGYSCMPDRWKTPETPEKEIPRGPA